MQKEVSNRFKGDLNGGEMMSKLTEAQIKTMLANHTAAINININKCDFCGAAAKYDGKTRMGPWAGMCEKDFKTYGVGLGLGRGQLLIAQSQAPKKKR
jgi:hypothetical protein